MYFAHGVQIGLRYSGFVLWKRLVTFSSAGTNNLRVLVEAGSTRKTYSYRLETLFDVSGFDGNRLR